MGCGSSHSGDELTKSTNLNTCHVVFSVIFLGLWKTTVWRHIKIRFSWNKFVGPVATGDVRNGINDWHLGVGHSEPRMQPTYCACIIAWLSNHNFSAKVVFDVFLLLLGMGHN